MKPLITEEELPPQACITIAQPPYIEHISTMRCSSYTSEWVAKALGLKVLSSNEILKGPVWHDYLRIILPLTILRLLKMRGMEGFVVVLDSFLPDIQKINWLRRELATKRKPIIILTKTTTLHWVVVAGYNDDEKVFYVYDPNFSKTSVNDEVPVGNKKVDYRRLINEWSGRWNFRYTAILILNDIHQIENRKVADGEGVQLSG